MHCTDCWRNYLTVAGSIWSHVAGDRVKETIFLAKMAAVVDPWYLAMQVTEELRLYENVAIRKPMSGRFLLQTTFASDVEIGSDFAVRVIVFDYARGRQLLCQALMHRFDRNQIKIWWCASAWLLHRQYEAQRFPAEQFLIVGHLVGILRRRILW